MGPAIGDVLPLAVVVALSPIPIIALILMLFTDRARPNSTAFTLGWIAGIVAVSVVVLVIASGQDLSTGGEPSAAVSWIKVALGLLMLLVAAKQWKSRPGPGADPRMPGWMTRIDTMKPLAALGLGVVLSGLNPKNLLLVLSAGVTIAQAELSMGHEAITIGVFTLVAASTVIVPTVAFLVAGQRVQPTLDHAKEWLGVHNSALMSVLLLVIGVSLVGKGLGAVL